MKHEAFDAKIEEYISLIQQLPEVARGRMMELVDETRERNAYIEEMAQAASDALDDWRLTVKYRLFHDEAARREAERRRHLDDE